MPVRFMLFLSLALALMGCPSIYKPKVGMIATEGLSISADDRSFVLEGSAPFPTPFWLETSEHRMGTSPCWKDDKTIVGSWKDYLAMGAKRVRVKYPGLKEPLYGVLAFCRIVTSQEGPATRSYLIKVDRQRVDATEDGQISTTWEEYGNDHQRGLAWVLFLSRLPLE